MHGVIILLFCLIIAVFITAYYQYNLIAPTQENIVTYNDITMNTVRNVNAKYGFVVTDADLPHYMQMLQNEVLMKKVYTYRDAGYQYNGSFYDNPKRAIPNRNPNVRDVNSCLNMAKSRGDGVAGLQNNGECWSGNSVSRAFMLGRHPSTATLGTGWNNQVYVRNESVETNIQYYDDLVSWMVNNGIKNYETIKLIVDLNNTEMFTTVGTLVEGATTVNGSTPPLEQTNMIAPSSNSNIASQTNHILSDISGFVLIKPLDPVFTTEILKIQKKALVPKFVELLRKNINKYSTKTQTLIDDIPSTYIVNVTNVLSTIGYQRSSDNLYDTLTVLNNFGIFTPDILKTNFTKKYIQFGMNSESKLLAIIAKLQQYKIQDIVDTNILTFNTFKDKAGQVIGLNAGNLFEFSEIITNFYNPSGTRADFVYFLNLMVEFDPTASVNMDRVRVFRDTLMKYGTNFANYNSLIKMYLRPDQLKVTTSSKKVLIEKFVNYYNNYSRNTVTEIIPIGNSLNGSTITLTTALSIFFNQLKKNNFKITNAFDFNAFLDDITSIKLSLNDISGHVFQKRYENYFEKFTSYENKEEFTDYKTYEGFVENLENGYADALRILGFTDVNKMPIYLTASSTELTMINGYDLDNKLRQTIGVTNSDEQYMVLSFFSKISMPGNQIYIMLDLLKRFNLNVQNFKPLTDAFHKLGLNDHTSISRFLKIILPFGVSFQTLIPFSDEVFKFKVNTKDTEAFFRFLHIMRQFDIIYKPSIYDSCNTKFSNFVFNFTYDRLDYTHFNTIILPMLTILNNGVVTPITDLVNADKRAAVNQNMRDVIIRKDKLFYGLDNPTPKNNKSLIGNCYTGPLNATPNYTGNFANFASNNYASTLTANRQFIRFMPLYTMTTNGQVKPSDKQEKDHVNTYLTPDKKGIDAKLFRFDKVISLLTACEYKLMKTQNPPNLIERSVMSRLLTLLITEAKPPEGGSTKDIVANYNAYANTINMIRFMPYKTFKMIANEIYSNNSYNNQTVTNKYDAINSETNRANSSNTFLPVIQECKGMTF